MQYKASDFYMLRTPIFSFNLYEQVFSALDENFNQDDAILDLLNNNVFLEAIAVSSPDLFSTVESFKQGSISQKSMKRLKKSLIKYVIRASTRTTPFGLFAGINIGSFEKETSIIIKDSNCHKKRARVDMEWLYGLINILESDKNIMLNINVKFNNICYLKGDRIINPIIGCNNINSKDSDISVSIRFTNQVKFVKDLSEKFISFGELSNILKENNPNTKSEVIDKFLYSLLKNQYLLSELRFPLCTFDPLEYIIDKIDKNDKAQNILDILNKLKYLISNYNSLDIGNGIEPLKEIWDIMSKIYKCKNYLQVDLKLESNSNKLGENVKNEMERFASLVVDMSKNMGKPSHIEKYTNEFVEKYGHYIEVSVLELLDEDIGLGAPSSYKNPQSNREDISFKESEIENEMKNLIYNKIIECKLTNNQEIILSDKDFNEILDTKLSDQYNEEIISFDMNFFVFGKSELEVNNGNFRLAIAPNIGSNSAGSMFGRFTDILSQNESIKLNKLLHSKEDLEHDKILVEVYETPQNGKLANICMNNSNIKYKMFLGLNNNNDYVLDIKDIYVGYDEITQSLYLKSKSLDKRVHFNLLHMLNSFSSSNIYRFLSEISDVSSSNFIKLLYSLDIQDLNYMPRISYEKVLLLPANWKLSLNILCSENNLYNFIEKFELWKNKYRIPKYVYYKVFDNRLVFDLSNKRHIEEIFNLIKNDNTEIKLYELEENVNNLLGKDNLGNLYFCETIVPFLLNNNIKSNIKNTDYNILNTKSNIHSKPTKIELLSDKRILFPGEEGWWYYNIYCNHNNIDDLIYNDIFEMCEILVKEKFIKMYFFIRYSDPKTHIRLRFKINDMNDINVVIFKLQSKFSGLKKKKLIQKINIGTYEREIERYGGIDLIHIAEEFFYYDSVYVATIITTLQYNKLNLTEEEIALISLASMLKNFKLKTKEQELLLSSKLLQKSYIKEFSKKRSTLVNILEKLYNDELHIIINDEKVYESLKKRSEILEAYYYEIVKIDNLEKLANTKLDILFSLMHMFCNRYKGDILWERKVMSLLEYSIYSFNQKKLKLEHEKI